MSEVEIQCPECGGLLILDAIEGFKAELWVCLKCDTAFSEIEIRERCGL